MTIAIIKYGMGNVASVQKALKKLSFNSVITDDHNEIKNSDFIILPGVGSFKKGMDNLDRSGLIDLLTNEVKNNKKPFLGICLGMQLLASYGNEIERTKGLDFIEGEVVEIQSKNNFRIPHLGWNNVKVHNNNPFYLDFENRDFYFIHSFHFDVKNESDITTTVNYDQNLVAAVQKDNIYGMQFHPEKSQEFGMKILKKVIEKYA